MTDSGTGVYRRPPMRMLDVSRVRRSFARVVDSVSERGDAVVIVRYGKPIAAIVPTMRLSREERGMLGSLKSPPATAPVRRKSSERQ